MELYEKFADDLIRMEKHWANADHLVYITLPYIKEDKLLIRCLESLYDCTILNISTILKFEHMYRRVNLSENKRQNLKIFFERCSKRYNLSESEAIKLKELIFLGKKHKESGFEFSKSGKMIILDDELGTFEITTAKIKEFVSLSKKLLENTNRNFKAKV